MQSFTLRPGDRFSASQFCTKRDDDAQYVPCSGISGCFGPRIETQLVKDPVNHIVDVNVPITENNRKYLGKVEIQGVVTLEDGTIVPTQPGEFKTKDFVIEREIELEEGEPIDWTSSSGK